MNLPGSPLRVLSGMRPTGRLHLGHYHGVLKNWVELQHEYESFFFVADWHAMTTHYETSRDLSENVWEMVIDWLAAGIDPGRATLFIQSRLLQHAELSLLLSMITPLSWLERVPSYKDQVEQFGEHLSTHGFLGYPLLQSADILIYRATGVPVGEDQVPHVELTREIARRFNYLYGRERDFEERAEAAIRKMGRKAARLYRSLRQSYTERGDEVALERARALLNDQQNVTIGDRERLYGYLEGGGRVILPEPRALLTGASKLPGLDGRKMSKSYGNTILMRDDERRVESRVRSMPTDPARVRRNDPGDPSRCPVWDLHRVYTGADVHEWIVNGCKSASIGCIECKQPLIDGMLEEQRSIRERASPYTEDPMLVRKLVADGCERAREVAEETMEEVREVTGLDYS